MNCLFAISFDEDLTDQMEEIVNKSTVVGGLFSRTAVDIGIAYVITENDIFDYDLIHCLTEFGIQAKVEKEYIIQEKLKSVKV